MAWRTRAEARAEAYDMQEAGSRMVKDAEEAIRQGKKKLQKGVDADPGELNWLQFILNLAATSDFNGEQLAKGLIYFGMGAVVVGIGGALADSSPYLNCCQSAGLTLGVIYFFAGVAHSTVALKS